MRKSKPTRSIEKLSESCTVGSSKDQQRKRKASTFLKNHRVSKTSIQEAEGGLTIVDNGATTKTRDPASRCEIRVGEEVTEMLRREESLGWRGWRGQMAMS
ncbi:hypothetical protein Cni_G22993 [Canna indica]|uniref:Uncharacterized protein n=1 Tax=Canna indica TaxID=4628 RepID=A0AAQ3KW81_9LILI|nr:hypothetical protein Cni_G22993 [Canna indica]